MIVIDAECSFALASFEKPAIMLLGAINQVLQTGNSRNPLPITV